MGEDTAEYQQVPMASAQWIAREFGRDWVVILGGDRAHAVLSVTPYGRTDPDKLVAARFGSQLVAFLNERIMKSEVMSEDRFLTTQIAELQDELEVAYRLIRELELRSAQLEQLTLEKAGQGTGCQ